MGPDDLARLRERSQRVIDEPEGLAFDPSTQEPLQGQPPYEPALNSTLELVWIDWREAPFHAWTTRSLAALAGREVQYWYNQLLFKPPRVGATTHWHQDDAYMGTGTTDLLLSCWLAIDDVDADMGCMEFFDRGHRDGIVPDLLPSDSSYGREDWDVDPARIVRCPLRAGGVTFHHGKTPHRTGGNTSDRWRKVAIQRFTIAGVERPTGH